MSSPVKLLVLSIAVLLGGCATGPRHLYNWDKYQPTLYQYYQKDRTSFDEQIAALQESIEKSRASGLPVPPGLHAHLGLLCMQTGKGAEALQHFEQEKILFPESAAFMDFLLKGKEPKK